MGFNRYLPSPRGLCRKHENARVVILNEVKNLARLIGCISRNPSVEFILRTSKDLRMTLRHNLPSEGNVRLKGSIAF